MQENRQAVDRLLAMYDRYKDESRQESVVANRLAKAKLQDLDTKNLLDEYTQIQEKIQEISSSMTFANPIIWMMYKFEAYKDEAQPIRTMNDFRIHCSKPGYICTKRFHFLDKTLVDTGIVSLLHTQHYGDELLLPSIFTDEKITEHIGSLEFQRQWNSYEYHQISGRVAKWENYEQ